MNFILFPEVSIDGEEEEDGEVDPRDVSMDSKSSMFDSSKIHIFSVPFTLQFDLKNYVTWALLHISNERF